MIKSISIKNFKSIVDLTVDLGQFNVFIGENGCGKSNILEGISLGAAASVHKLDREFFANRGIRYTEPFFMYSAFDNNDNRYIYIDISFSESSINNKNFKLRYNTNLKPAQWEDLSFNEMIEKLHETISKIELTTIKDKLPSLKIEKSDIQKLMSQFNENLKKINLNTNKLEFTVPSFNNSLQNYNIFSLEESILRKFDADNAIHPLGRNGEGLFAYLKEISQKENGIEILKEIKENLCILDWFDDLEIPKDQLSNEFSLRVKDKYINDTLHFFDQRSTNEGFLYLLFYLTLFISDDTPSFFAIDNLEASFNPKLCREITKRLILLAKQHNKQVIVTTHSPAILDGLDITNDNERLFVIRRNIDGYTKANRIEYKTDTNLALSEAWLKGYIGGLPENF